MDRKILYGIIILIVLGGSIAVWQYMQPKEFTITVSGAFALYPLMVEWGDEYSKIHPNVHFSVSAGGAGKGMTDALGGLVDIGMVSRSVSPDEVSQGAFYVACVKDCVLVTINANNPVLLDLEEKGISKQVLIDIFVTGNVTTWGQLVGKPDINLPINVYVRSDSCGATDTLVAYMNKKSTDLKGTGIYGDPGVADAVKADINGIGYNNLNFAYDVSTGKPVTGLSIIPLDVNGNGVIDSSESFYGELGDIVNAIATGAYPSPPARELNLVTKNSFSGETLSFVKWVLADGQKLAVANGYVPLTSERASEMLKKLGG